MSATLMEWVHGAMVAKAAAEARCPERGEAEADTRWARRPSGTSSSSGRPRPNER
jgi:hypothetical protein